MERRPLRIEADWVWPVTSEAVRDGAIMVGSAGRIEALGSRDDVPHRDGYLAHRLPAGSVVLPGLINAHTHLELTGLRGRVNDDDFFAWIQHIRQAKADLNGADFIAAARDGIHETWRFGITAVADTGDTGAAFNAMNELGAKGVAYQEVFGPHPDQANQACADLESTVVGMVSGADSGVSLGISPHAPYSVSEDLFRLAANLAQERGLPTATHAAESRAEQELVTEFAGPFAAMWRARRIPPIRRARSTVALLERAGLLSRGLLLIHGVRFSDEDIDSVRRFGCSVVLCPGSNLRHGHGLPPARQLLDRGVTVGLGTDSVASVGSTNLLQEARIAVAELHVSPVEAVRMLTVEGACAIGCGDRAGTLDVGQPADLCCLQLGRVRNRDELAPAVVAAGDTAFLETYVEGRRVYAAGPA